MSRLMDWWLNVLSGGQHYRDLERERQRERKRKERDEERKARVARMHYEFTENFNAVLSQPVVIPESSTTHCTPGSTHSAPNSCSCSSSCSSSSSCGGGGGGD